MFNTFNPYWWAPTIPINEGLPRIDVGGIFKLSTNAVSLSEATVDYGINPCLYNKLPCESIVLLTISADVPNGGDTLPTVLVVPNEGTSTVSGSTTKKVNIIDSQGTNITGANIKGNTQRLAYINKSTGIIRFMEFTNA